MAKKSSNNAVEKINKQLESLEDNKKNSKKEEKESVPVIDKRIIKKELNKRDNIRDTIIISDVKVKNKKNKNKSNREDIIVNEKKYKTRMKNNRPIRDTIIAVDTTKKNNYKPADIKKVIKKEKGLSQEESVKFNELETEMRSLYDRVNDVVEDIDNHKIDKDSNIKINNILLSDRHIKDVDEGKTNFTILNRIIIVLSIIFGILFILFVTFIIFVTTF